MNRNRQAQQRGFILLMVLALLAIGSILTASFYALLHTGIADAYQRDRQQTARNLADAGLEKAIASLRMDPKYAGETDTPFGEGSFSVTTTAGARPGAWSVVSTGKFGGPDAGFHAKASVVADMELDAQGRVRTLYLREDGAWR